MWDKVKEKVLYFTKRLKDKVELLDRHLRILSYLGWDWTKVVASWPFKKTRTGYRLSAKWLSTKRHNTKWGIIRRWRTITGFASKHKSEILTFLHITLAAFFFIWGMEVIALEMGFSIWRVLVGGYIILWCGVMYLWNIIKVGIYLS